MGTRLRDALSEGDTVARVDAHGDLVANHTRHANATDQPIADPAGREAYAEMADFAKLYANRWIRMAMTLTEILPVGVLVSAISAALLRRPQFMPARAA